MNPRNVTLATLSAASILTVIAVGLGLFPGKPLQCRDCEVVVQVVSSDSGNPEPTQVVLRVCGEAPPADQMDEDREGIRVLACSAPVERTGQDPIQLLDGDKAREARLCACSPKLTTNEKPCESLSQARMFGPWEWRAADPSVPLAAGSWRGTGCVRMPCVVGQEIAERLGPTAMMPPECL